MAGPHPRSLPAARRAEFWGFVRSGLPWRDAALTAGVSISAGRDGWRGDAASTTPGPHPTTVTFEHREDIAEPRARGCSNAEIAREIGVHRSTVGRELAKGPTR